MSNTPEQYRCRHIFTNGRQCGSPALRQENFCYYHHTTRLPAPAPRRSSADASENFDLRMPEDRLAIQSNIGEVLRRIAAGTIDSRRAALLLYGCSIASANLPRSAKAETQPSTELLCEIVTDSEHGTLAPLGDPLRPESNLSSLGQYLVSREREGRERAEQALAKAEQELAAYRSGNPPLSLPPYKPYIKNGIIIPPSSLSPQYQQHVAYMQSLRSPKPNEIPPPLEQPGVETRCEPE